MESGSGYTNVGSSGVSGAISVSEGDYIQLGYNVNSTARSWAGTWQLEVLEGSLLGHYFASTIVTNSDNITVQANNTADETVYPIFVDGATGIQGPESDTGFTYNPSSGNLTATQLTGTLQTASQTNITALGTIATGTWNGTAIGDSYISSAATWNAKQAALTFGIANTNALKIDDADAADNDYAKLTASGIEGRSYSEVKTDLSLDNVENTALSTWAGTSNITTVGTLGSLSVTGDVSIGGTLTYEDVTNIDSVGIVTARSGIEIPNDTYKLRLGTDLETQVFHDGTNTVVKDTRNDGKVRIQADNFDVRDKDDSQTLISAGVDGSVSLSHSGNQKIQTTSTGAVVTGVLTATSFSGDGSALTSVSATDSTKLPLSGGTIDGNMEMTGNVFDFAESKQLRFGAGNDFAILHNGNTLLENETTGGNLTLNNKSTSGKIYLNVSDGDNALVATPDGSVEIHYANAKKLETTSTGAVVTGVLTATSFSGDGQYLTNVGSAATDAWISDAQYNLVAGTGAGANRDADTERNVIIGTSAGCKLNAGDYNVFLGANAGYYTTTGNTNFYGGYGAGVCNQSGDKNVAIGSNALMGSGTPGNNSGGCNVAIGRQAGCKVSSGSDNIALGRLALGTGTVTGSDNIALGESAGTGMTSGHHNIMLGDCAGRYQETGSYNTYFGTSAAQSMRGSYNVAFGRSALAGAWGSCTGNTGGCNIAIGKSPGSGMTTGTDNIMLGCRAAYNITTGSDNIALGQNAAACGTLTGSNNITLGCKAATNLTSGSNNVAIGLQAGKCLTDNICNVFLGNYAGCRVTGGCNTALGTYALTAGSDVSGDKNVAIGYNVQVASDTGSSQLAIGDGTGCWISGDSSFNVTLAGIATATASGGIFEATKFCGDGSCLTGISAGFDPDAQENLYAGTNAGANSDADTCFNIALGYCAGCSLNEGDDNIILGGRFTGRYLTSGSRNVFIGCQAGMYSITNTDNVFLGSRAGFQMCSGDGNVAIGECALKGSTTTSSNSGACNIAIGNQAGLSVTSANDTIFMGRCAGMYRPTGAYNIAFGKEALLGSSTVGSNTGSNNISLGAQAGKSITSGGQNIAIGKWAMRDGTTTGSYNNMFGDQAGYNLTSGGRNSGLGNGALYGLTEGLCNVAVGSQAGYQVSTGDNNILLGFTAGCLIAGGDENVIIGKNSGKNTADANKNVFLGSQAGETNTSGCCNVAIGYDVDLPSATGNTQFAIGVGANRWITGDNNFDVGIGHTNPIFKLDVVNGTANTGANVNNPGDLSVTGANKTLIGGGANVFINSNTAHAVDTGGSLGFSGRNTDSSTNSVLWGTIKGAKENGTTTNTAGYLAFAVSNHSAGALQEKLRIGSSGQLGIGGANYGTDGQVLTSTGPNSAPAWEDASGGGGGSSGPDPVIMGMIF